MERRHKAARGGSPGGLAGGASSPTQPRASAAGWLHIQALIDGGGQIMIGTLAPIRGAAVAHDGNKTLAMLRRRPGEALPALLGRLDAAIATAKSIGSRVDEINDPSSERRYEI
jgi:hypothetical protein